MAFDYDYAGNLTLLDRPTVAFFASRVVPSGLYERALRWAEECCATDRVVISGFHSPLEKAVFRLLLEARHPVIWALGRSLYRHYPPEVQAAFAEEAWNAAYQQIEEQSGVTLGPDAVQVETDEGGADGNAVVVPRPDGNA